MQRNISLPNRHDQKLIEISKRLGISKSEVVRRAIDALEEKEAQRDHAIKDGKCQSK